jgi:hypothetical protein
MSALVSLREFAVSGAFDRVVPGCTPAELESAFGAPEATGGESRRHRRPSIWKYGDVQFFFGRSGGLRMVHLDTFFGPDGKPEGWGGLQLEPWCVRAGLPLAEFLAAAFAVGCEGRVTREPRYERVVVSFPSGVEVGFTPDDGLFGLWRAWTAEPAPAPERAGG